MADQAALAYLLRFDTILGRFPDEVSVRDGHLYVAGRQVKMLTEEKGAQTTPPWGDLGVDTVIEATSQVPHPRGGGAPPGGRRQAGDPLLAAGRPAGHHGGHGGQRGPAPARAPDRLQRLVHRPRRGAGAGDPRRRLRHRAGVPHHRPRLHQPAAAGRRAGRGPAPGPRRGARTSSRRRPTPPRSSWACCPTLQGKLTGLAMNVPVPNGSVVDLVCWHAAAGHRRGGQRGGAHGGRELALEEHPGLRGRADRLLRHPALRGLGHLRQPRHHGARRQRLQDPDLVRQRLGLRPPRRRPAPPFRAIDRSDEKEAAQ